MSKNTTIDEEEEYDTEQEEEDRYEEEKEVDMEREEYDDEEIEDADDEDDHTTNYYKWIENMDILKVWNSSPNAESFSWNDIHMLPLFI